MPDLSELIERDFGETAANLARDILLALGYAQSPSMEPSADERRDRVARLIEAQIASLRAENERLTKELQETRMQAISDFGQYQDSFDTIERLTKERDELDAQLTGYAEARNAQWARADAAEARAQAAEAALAEMRERVDHIHTVYLARHEFAEARGAAKVLDALRALVKGGE